MAMQGDSADNRYMKEIEALRAQLEEAQAVVRAIRGGEIDAVLISGHKGGQVFALENTDRPYRVMVEAMQEGAATLLPNGMILYANQRFAEMLKLPLNRIFGTQIHKLVLFSDQVAFANLLQQSAITPIHGEVVLSAGDGTLVPVSVALNPLSLEEVPAISMIATDLTHQKRRENEILLIQRLQSAVSAAPDVRSALEMVLATISETRKSIYAEAWTRAADGTTLECSSIWSSDRRRFQKFSDAGQRQTFAGGSEQIAQVWETRTLNIIPDTDTSIDALPFGLQAGVIVPIVVEEETVAVLAFFSAESDDSDTHFVRLVSTVAGQLGSFIQRKQTEEALIKAHRELESRVLERTAELTQINAALQSEVEERTRIANRIARLQNIIIAFSASLTRDEVADVMISRALEAVGAVAGGIVLLADTEQRLELLGSRGFTAQLVKAWQSVSLDRVPPLFQSAVRSKEAIWFRSSQEIVGSGLSDNTGFQQSASWSVIPLTIGEIVKGILVLVFPQQAAINDDTRSFVLALAEQCAQALARAHLYEAEAKARYEAELANQVKLKFLGMISHELRTPLTSIKGFLSTLLSNDVVWPPDQQREFIVIADAEADKLTDLVDQLLDVSRLHAGSIHIAPKPCRFTEILEIAAAQFDTLTKQHVFVMHISPGLPLILADQQRIAQVLVNLVGNATKYSPAGTTIELYAEMTGDYLQVEIIDQGMGIPEEDREIIFEAFRQVERKDGLRNQHGAGLGLAICKGLVEAHQGHIWVNPLHTQGTSICFTIPRMK